jgi:hypothetical protein
VRWRQSREGEAIMSNEDTKRAAHRALVDRVLNAHGRTSRQQRARAFNNVDLLPPTQALIGKLTAPLGFRAGLLVAFQIGLVNPDNPAQRVANDFLFFGLSQDHRRLAFERTGGTLIAEAELGPRYHPLAASRHSVALRVLRRGELYRFDARIDSSTIPPGGFGDIREPACSRRMSRPCPDCSTN